MGGRTSSVRKKYGLKLVLGQIIQTVFQDPYSGLNSRYNIGTILSKPLWLYAVLVRDFPHDVDALKAISLVSEDRNGCKNTASERLESRS